MRYLYDMTKIKYILFTIFLCCTLCNTSCIEDSFTTSSNHLLEFSCDTLSFDTMFTELGSPTKQFIIYNRHKQMLNISSISFEGNQKARFFMNVDGMKGNEFNNVEIRGGDSIYVFVESIIDATNQNAPLEITDRINFVTNGITQSVVLTAWGQDVTRLTRPEYDTDYRMTAERPYVIFDTLHVAEGATLTIDAGTTLYFHDKAAMKIDGTIIANGTQQQPIHLRGDRTDYLFEGANYNIMAGQWGGVEITESSKGNEFNYVLMRGSSNGVTVKANDTDTRALHLFNSVLHNSANNVLTVKNAWVDAEGCELSNAAENVLAITGGKCHFAHCTIANYYIFGITGNSVIHIDLEDEDKNPLHPVVFIDNSIITGIVGDINIGDFTGHEVYIRHTMLRSNGSDDDNFINCRWGGDAKFYMDRENYIFDYRLKNESDAIAQGSASLCPANAQIDRYGNPRLRNGSIDMGAYTWIEAEEENKDSKQNKQ